MARIDHSNCSHLPTARDRAACRANRALNLTVSTPEPVVVAAPVIRFKRVDATNVTILLNGEKVGTIVKRTREEIIMIPGTRLRRAAGRNITAYHVELDRAGFSGAIREQLVDRCGMSRLADAKRDAISRINAL